MAALPPSCTRGLYEFPGCHEFITGALQFIVAAYALRLNRIFGTARVGWSLFWPFHFWRCSICFNP